MSLLRSISFAAMGAILAFRSAGALEPRGTDILTVRLGMTVAEVIGTLTAQGFAGAGLEIVRIPCREAPGTRCVSMVSTRTKDGAITVSFTDASVVSAIVYRFDGKKPGEPEAILTSVRNRYGPATHDGPTTWCTLPPGVARCPDYQPRLMLQPASGTSLVLTLVGPTGVLPH